jgi:endonuclease-3
MRSAERFDREQVATHRGDAVPTRHSTNGSEVSSAGARDRRKRRFDIHAMLERIREAVRDFPDAAMFELRDAGFGTVFQQLVACVISIRTRDEVSLPLALRLLEHAPTPEKMARLSLERIDELIHDSTFHEAKAAQIREIAERTVREFGGELPCDADVLMSFRGVGPKCANLAMGVACGADRISVDVHVWRVTNRWGYVSAPTPEATMVALERVLPREYWIEINRLLVPFGKHICTARLPKCSTCPVLEYCQQVGVTQHR